LQAAAAALDIPALCGPGTRTVTLTDSAACPVLAVDAPAAAAATTEPPNVSTTAVAPAASLNRNPIFIDDLPLGWRYHITGH
jgi:hypothetical protein